MKRQQTNTAVGKFLQSIFDHGLENTGLYYSVYPGLVFNRDDPENLQRLKLIIPQVSGMQAYDYWSFPKGVFYGQGYGMQLLPKKGDMVWVEFIGGKPELPIWSHGHPARKEPPKDSELNDKDCIWFITPGGHKIKINDTKSTIHVEHARGHYVELNKQSISVVHTQISLGKLDKSKYKALLGEEVEDVLKDIKDYLAKLTDALNKDCTGPFIKTAEHLKALPKLNEISLGLPDKIDKILSKINTLE